MGRRNHSSVEPVGLSAGHCIDHVAPTPVKKKLAINWTHIVSTSSGQLLSVLPTDTICTKSHRHNRIGFLSVVTLYPSFFIVRVIAVEESKICQHQLQAFFEGPNQKFPILLRACRRPSTRMKQKRSCSLFVFAFLAPFLARSENVGWRPYFNEERQAFVH